MAGSGLIVRLNLCFLLMAASFPHATTATTDRSVPSRVTQTVDESERVTLHGVTHPLARTAFDQGTAPDKQPINRIVLLLQRSPEQEKDLRKLLDEQQIKVSTTYHRWLTPGEFGERFGPSDSDIQVVTGWLTSHGFSVARVSAGKTVIEFSGNAGQIDTAFRTQVHKYSVHGEDHWANADDPSIPAALAPVIAGLVSLDNFPLGRSNTRGLGVHKQEPRVSPLYTTSGSVIYAVGPYDFATIYNSLPLWNSTPSIDGTGQSIALVERSDICTSGSPDFGSSKPCGERDDIQNFRSYFGLPLTLPGGGSPVVVIVNGPNPGIIEPLSSDSAAPDDEREAILDAEVAGGVARNAQIKLVVSQTTEATDGAVLSAEYIIDNNLAPVMSVSFLKCEASVGSTFNSLWEQAAAQGITVAVSSGDSGSAGCDAKTSSAASQGLAVNGIASTPFNVAVGGTDFHDAGNQHMYWSSSDNPTTNESALSYIPEVPWNNSCAANGLTGCSSVSSSSSSLNVLAGGGGSSKCPSTSGSPSCAKPSWQSGPVVTGSESADGVRDIPDIALFSSSGSSSESAYVICISDANSGDHACPSFFFDGGTSASAPAFAGVMAMVNQFMVAQGDNGRQGNANYVLYALANRQVQAATQCTSSSVNTGNNCVFYDITQGNNSVPCVGGSPNCSSATVGTIGVLADANGNLAWSAGPGYDLASGLGSLNVMNLVRSWPSAVGSFEPTSTSLQLCSAAATDCIGGGSNSTLTVDHGAIVSVSVGVSPIQPTSEMPTGDAVLIGSPNTRGNNGGSPTSSASYFTLPNPTLFTISRGRGSGQSTALVGGSYQVQVHYAGDGTFAASDSLPVNVAVTPESSTTSLSLFSVVGVAAPFGLGSGSSVQYGTPVLVHVAVSSANSNQTGGTSASGVVDLGDNGLALDGGSFALNSAGFADVQTGIGSVPPLAVGAHSFQGSYGGDANYRSSQTSGRISVVVTPATTSVALTPGSTMVVTGGSVLLTATVSTGSVGAAPSNMGTIKFMSNSIEIAGTPQYKQRSGFQPEINQPGVVTASLIGTLNYQPTATTNITSSFGGDSNYASSSSTGTTQITVVPYLISSPNTSTANEVVISASGQTGTSSITVQLGTQVNSVTLFCSISPMPSNSVTSCDFSPGNTINASGKVELELKTTASSATATMYAMRFENRIACLTGLTGLAAVFYLWSLTSVHRQRCAQRCLILLIVACLLGSCGKKTGGSISPGTIPGTYAVTVFGSPTSSQSVVVYFNVQ